MGYSPYSTGERRIFSINHPASSLKVRLWMWTSRPGTKRNSEKKKQGGIFPKVLRSLGKGNFGGGGGIPFFFLRTALFVKDRFWRWTRRRRGLQCGKMEAWLNVLLYGCFRKLWYPQIIHFNRVSYYKPSILGYRYFWKHPYCSILFVQICFQA